MYNVRDSRLLLSEFRGGRYNVLKLGQKRRIIRYRNEAGSHNPRRTSDDYEVANSDYLAEVDERLAGGGLSVAHEAGQASPTPQ